MKSIIFIKTHLINKCIKKFIKQLTLYSNRKVVVLYDNSQIDLSKFEICKTLPYSVKDFENIYPICKEKCFNPFWYNADYPLLLHMNKFDFDYAYMIEYDVRFPGKWSYLFDYYDKYKEDLLGAYSGSFETHPNYWWWCNSGTNFNNDEMRRIFFPFVRFSKKALEYLDKKYKDKVTGYCEILVPTLLNMAGFSIRDIAKENKYFNASNYQYKPNLQEKDVVEMTLYHPVKENIVTILPDNKKSPAA